MASRELYLIQVPSEASKSDIMNIKTVEELDKTCSRFTNTIEQDLKKRLFVYRQDRQKWYAEPKIKRIYKYIPIAKQPKISENKVHCSRKLRTLKKIE